MIEQLPADWQESARDFGLVAVGGNLEPATLLHAYRSGAFPWYDEAMPICWWSPDPRGIFDLDTFQPTRRLARTCRSNRFRVTVNQNFAGVIRGCTERRGDGIWIIPAMIDAYERLHRLGWAHSVEVWQEHELVGGLYGVAINGFFAGESMFHRARDASKVALVHTVERLRSRGFTLFDTQFLTPHTRSMGAIDIPRDEYLARLDDALCQDVRFD